MSLSAGKRIGPYEILGPIGAGGMGEVCRARDTKLDREVAIKVLPPGFAQDQERLGRFEREAKVLASLNHPNIAQIYGVEESESGPALVMELIRGESLKGPVPVETALRYARQIADALEAAHEKGIVHRDLKPANIMVTAAGVVKVLDFGLAAIMQPANGNPETSPTMTMGATSAGLVMGTAGYMSPEQASGKPVDKRADIWAFGVVLYEMLSGQRLFDGETVAHSLAAVLTKDPDWTLLPGDTPRWVRRLLARCLERDPKRRLRDIGEAFHFAASEPEPVAAVRAGLPRWVIPAMTGLAIVTGLGGWLLRAPKQVELPLRAFSFAAEALSANDNLRRAVISPNGKYIAYVAGRKLWIRDLAMEQARILEGTDNAEGPFWSPDSAQIAFAAGTELKKVGVNGGGVLSLATVGYYRGGGWSADGKTLVVGAVGALAEMPASGGTLKPVKVDAAAGFLFSPHFIPSPSGRRLVLVSEGGRDIGQEMLVVDLDRGERHELGRGAIPAYAPGGYVIFQSRSTGGGLWALKLSADGIHPEGEAVPLSNIGGAVSASLDGTMVWTEMDGDQSRQMVWRDRRGNKVGTAGDPQLEPTALNLSMDGRRVSVSVLDGANRDIWIFDLERSVRTRFTFDKEFDGASVWAPSGTEIAWRSSRSGGGDIFIQAADGSGEPRPIVTGPFTEFPTGWAPDGRTLLFTRNSLKPTYSDVWFVRRKADGAFEEPIPFVQSTFGESAGQFSPDGRFVAYTSNESGRAEVYVRAFPDASGKRQISTGGGGNPRWSRDGKEIFYETNEGLFAVPISLQGALTAGAAVELFRIQLPLGGYHMWDVAPDGKRFLISEQVVSEGVKPPAIHVVQNWKALLKQKIAIPEQ